MHLLQDAAAAIGVDFESLAPLGRGRAKAAFRPEDPPHEPQRIDRIVVLSTGEEATSVSVSHPSGAARMTALLDHTIRDGIAPLVLGQEHYFALVADLANIVPITRIERPREEWTLDDVLDAIEAGA